MSNHVHTNRLAKEKSPYLLQHAHNPVDWYPWGHEAFEKARREDKPIFLSIGYATCHWCHVMERESFEDDEVAALLNRDFVCIKVDREERPDIDQVYMKVCMMLTGSGGWPLTIVMTPDRAPFFAGTYFPKQGRFGRGGMMEMLPAIAAAWKEERSNVVASVEKIRSALSQRESSTGKTLDASVIQDSVEALAGNFDPVNGGFGRRPKFPSPHTLSLLLRHYSTTGDTQSLAMVEQTLHAMRAGGIYDQVGYGFHRYSTDEGWLVPHFEKMLYDQAMMVLAYIEAFQVTGRPEYAATVREVLTYVQRDLSATDGGFLSAEDADSEGEEGKFYVWTFEELNKVLSGEGLRAVVATYGVTPEGNFHDEATAKKTGANILHMGQPAAAVAKALKLALPELNGTLATAREKLLAVRSKRVRPLLDDKVLADWNGLMIAAMARAGWVLNEPALVARAGRAADFVMKALRKPDGGLLHRYRDGEAAIPGMLDDYAFMIWGLVELYEAGHDPSYLASAVALMDRMNRDFWDEAAGAYFFTAHNAEPLISREKESYDGAIPSGNSIAFLGLLKLGALTGNPDYLQRADRLSQSLGAAVASMPAGHAQFLCGLDLALGPTAEVVLVAEPGRADTEAMLAALRGRFLPRVSRLVISSATRGATAKCAPYTTEQEMLRGKATAYVCRGGACRRPTTDPAAMLKDLEGSD